MLIASTTPAVVYITSSGPSWLIFALTQLGSFLAGTATALLVQLYIVPDVETRKRREDRWERDVRELNDILATRLTDLANEAWAAQALYREERTRTDDEYDPAVVRHAVKEARDATFAFGSVISTRAGLLMGRVLSINPEAEEIKRLKRLNGEYQLRTVFVRGQPEDDKRTHEEFDETWQRERNARETLIKQVQTLEGMRPPSRPRKLPRRPRR